MAVTINHGYAPSQTQKYVQYAHTVTSGSDYNTQIHVPAYYDGVMQFSGYDLFFNRADIVYALTSCEYTDTSNDVRKYWSEWDPDYNLYLLKYRINGDPPTIITDSNSPIYFGWCASNGAYWDDGVTPGFQAYVTGFTTWGRSFGGGTVRVNTRVTVTLTNRKYSVAETVTRV